MLPRGRYYPMYNNQDFDIYFHTILRVTFKNRSQSLLRPAHSLLCLVSSEF
jgi:hypothetical protein